MKKEYFYADSQGTIHNIVGLDFFKKNPVPKNSYIWFAGLPEWVKAETVRELCPYLTESVDPPHLPSIPPGHENYEEKQHKKMLSTPPKNWLIESILVTLLCFLPAGIVGIVYASKVNIYWNQGMFAESVRCSDKAALWAKWGILIAVIIAAIYIILALWIPASLVSVFEFDKLLGY